MDITSSTAWRTAAKHAHDTAVEQRNLVLAYRDISARLCQPPLRYASPDQWTGYIPPAFDREDASGVTPRNDSPIRAALLALVEAAAERYDRDHPHRAAAD